MAMQTHRLLSLLQPKIDFFFFLLKCIFALLLNWFLLHSRLMVGGLSQLLHISPVDAKKKFATQELDLHTCSPRRVCGASRSVLRSLDGVLCALPWAAVLGSLLESLGRAHIEGVDNYQTRSDSSDTKAALTSSLLVASEGQSHSLHTRLTQNTSHHSWEAGTSCFITRHETDFFQLQWTGHKPRLTTSSAQTEQREDGWAGTEDRERGRGGASGDFSIYCYLL